MAKAFFEYRMKWDGDSLANHEVRDTSHKNVKLTHSLFKSKMRFNAKTFVEKRVMFSHEGNSVYSYLTRNTTCEQDYGNNLE